MTVASVQLHLHARRVQTTTYPGHTHTQTDLGTSVCKHTRNYKDTPVHGQTSTHVHYMRRSGYQCYKTVRVQVQRASLSTWTIARSAHHPGCPCQMRYRYKYSVRAHPRGHDQYIAQAPHAIKLQAREPSRDRCITTGTSTACELRHAGTIGTLLRLSMP